LTRFARFSASVRCCVAASACCAASACWRVASWCSRALSSIELTSVSASADIDSKSELESTLFARSTRMRAVTAASFACE